MDIHSVPSFDHIRRQSLPVILPIHLGSCRKSAQLVVPCESLDSVLITTPFCGAEVQVIGPPSAYRSPLIIAPLLARHFEDVIDAYNLVVVPIEALLVAFGKLVKVENFVLVWDPPPGVRLGIFRCGDASEN